MISSLTRCPNCGALPEFGHSRDSYYKFYLSHMGTGCPNAIEIFHHSEAKCVEQWEKYCQGELEFYKGDDV